MESQKPEEGNIRELANLTEGNILYSRYSYCKSLLAELKAKPTLAISNNGAKGSTQQIPNAEVPCGMLLDNLQLTDETYSVAVRAVLGGESAYLCCCCGSGLLATIHDELERINYFWHAFSFTRKHNRSWVSR